LFSTTTPLSIFTNYFYQRLDKLSFLESILEILQQFYVKMETKPEDFCLFPGDLSMYTLKCVRCCKSITAPGSIGETLFHAPTAMLSCWDMIHPHEDTNDSEMVSISLVFTSDDSFLQSSASVNSTSGDNEHLVLKKCNNSSWKGEHRFCETVKVDMIKSKERLYNHTILSTLSLITVLFEVFLWPFTHTRNSLIWITYIALSHPSHY
jgi:hypothetical protein